MWNPYSFESNCCSSSAFIKGLDFHLQHRWGYKVLSGLRWSLFGTTHWGNKNMVNHTAAQSAIPIVWLYNQLRVPVAALVVGLLMIRELLESFASALYPCSIPFCPILGHRCLHICSLHQPLIKENFPTNPLQPDLASPAETNIPQTASQRYASKITGYGRSLGRVQSWIIQKGCWSVWWQFCVDVDFVSLSTDAARPAEHFQEHRTFSWFPKSVTLFCRLFLCIHMLCHCCWRLRHGIWLTLRSDTSWLVPISNNSVIISN